MAVLAQPHPDRALAVANERPSECVRGGETQSDPPPDTLPAGTRVEVYWTGDLQWFPATVVSSHLANSNRSRHHVVQYDEAFEDGDYQRTHNFQLVTCRRIDRAAAAADDDVDVCRARKHRTMKRPREEAATRTVQKVQVGFDEKNNLTPVGVPVATTASSCLMEAKAAATDAASSSLFALAAAASSSADALRAAATTNATPNLSSLKPPLPSLFTGCGGVPATVQAPANFLDEAASCSGSIGGGAEILLDATQHDAQPVTPVPIVQGTWVSSGGPGAPKLPPGRTPVDVADGGAIPCIRSQDTKRKASSVNLDGWPGTSPTGPVPE